MGNLFHQSVEHFAVEALLKDPDMGKQLSDENVAQMMDRIVDQTLANEKYEVFRSDARSAYMVNKLKRTGKRAAKLMLSHLRKGVFDPKAFEVGFGTESGNIPPICIALSGGEKIYLEGRIDRIDVYDSGQSRYVKVIDYKSGFKKYHLGDVYNGLQIQLMVYMDAVLSAPEAFQLNDPVYPAGVFYFKIDDPMVEAENLTAEDIENAINKQLKMDGLVVGDRYVAAFMDEDLKEDGSRSEVIPFEIKKEGEPGRYASYLSNEHFKALLSHVKKEVVNVCEEMIDGKVAVSPYRCGSEVACDRCDYKGLCQFDLSLKDNSYRNLLRLERDSLIERLENGNESGREGVDTNGAMD
jgi:ATP-dependent helicase/nuclease subunit B